MGDKGTGQGNRRRVLLVEDHAILRQVVAHPLRQYGYDVVEADGVMSALAALAAQIPTIIIRDIALPDGSGWEVLRHLPPRRDRIGIIVCSAWRPSRSEMAAHRPDVFLAKPFAIEALLHAMTEVYPGAAATTIQEQLA